MKNGAPTLRKLCSVGNCVHTLVYPGKQVYDAQAAWASGLVYTDGKKGVFL